jgi:O-antigen ligase
VPAGRRPARGGARACGALAGYAAWSYLSVSWAAQKGDAWDGANRAALYALVFAAFALWPIRARAAAALVGVFALAIAALALVQLGKIAWASNPTGYFIDGRLATPISYPSGDAALWSTAFWPCVVFGSRRECAPELRGVFVGAAVVLGSMALLGQSRGWLFALPLVAAIFVVATPGRVRTPLTLLLVLAGVGVTIPAVLNVYDKRGTALATALDGTANWTLGAAVVAGALAAVAGIADRRRRVSRIAARRAGAAMLATAAVALVLGAGVYVAERDPLHDVSHAWKQFTTQGNPEGGSSRLDRLGSNRYDFWRVAWNRFAGAPLGGIGADNFREAYLHDARSREQPRFPHSLELRTLSQTGLVGAALLGAALVAALGAAWRGVRGRAGPGAAAAAAGLGAFVYWLVHGSVDWFWEVPALGGAAFALLGIAAGLAPRGGSRARRPLASSTAAVAAAVTCAVLLAISFGAPALAERLVNRATSVYPSDARKAFDELDSAAALNPLSSRPKVIAARVALALHRPADAERYFRQALARDPDEPYAHLELGAIVFDAGRRAEGLRLLERAASLEPRVRVTSEALARARRGRRVDVDRINAALLARGREIVR